VFSFLVWSLSLRCWACVGVLGLALLRAWRWLSAGFALFCNLSLCRRLCSLVLFTVSYSYVATVVSIYLSMYGLLCAPCVGLGFRFGFALSCVALLRGVFCACTWFCTAGGPFLSSFSVRPSIYPIVRRRSQKRKLSPCRAAAAAPRRAKDSSSYLTLRLNCTLKKR
jgi:hypothetical protein